MIWFWGTWTGKQCKKYVQADSCRNLIMHSILKQSFRVLDAQKKRLATDYVLTKVPAMIRNTLYCSAKVCEVVSDQETNWYAPQSVHAPPAHMVENDQTRHFSRQRSGNLYLYVEKMKFRKTRVTDETTVTKLCKGPFRFSGFLIDFWMSILLAAWILSRLLSNCSKTEKPRSDTHFDDQ